ncbi:MAG TPA: ABC transporter ATP-binding protein [Solirubrobacterales bacterium]|nr:ABC transporter ATP-binding protein [Solirubrobacterales bacterium]
MLKVRGVHKSYETVRALDGVDLDVERGEIVALLGPNGAGKSTLVSVVAGLCRPDQGEIRLNGIDTRAHPGLARQQVGLSPQETGIYPILSVRDNLRFFGELAGLRRPELERRIEEVAAAFSLGGLLGRQGRKLSGGEARRLHTAMIVLQRSPLLLLDEVTAGVDVQARKQLLDLIGALAGRGSAVLYCTHYLHEIEALGAQRVAILLEGRVVIAGSVAELVGALGGSFVELRFDRQPAGLDLPPGTVAVEENVLRVPAEGSPAVAAAELAGRLDRSGATLREIKLVQPSLESVFLSVTAGTSNGGPP